MEDEQLPEILKTTFKEIIDFKYNKSSLFKVCLGLTWEIKNGKMEFNLNAALEKK